MAITEKSKTYHEKMFPGYVSSFLETDPEFIERFDNFTFDEVVNSDNLDDKTRWLAVLATLLGCQGIDEFKVLVPAVMNFGVSPVEIKEVVYQAVAYLGIGRVFPFLKAVNEIFTAKGIKLPLKGQSTTTINTRLEAGRQAQVDIMGEGMKDFYKSDLKKADISITGLPITVLEITTREQDLIINNVKWLHSVSLLHRGDVNRSLLPMRQQISVSEMIRNFLSKLFHSVFHILAIQEA